MHAIKNLRPDKFTVQDLDDELACMMLIRSLPVEQFSAFRSSLLLLSDIKLSTLKEAFQLEEENRRPSASTLALSTSASAAAAATSESSSQCHFCQRTGHFQADCSKYIEARRVAQDSSQNSGRRCRARGKRLLTKDNQNGISIFIFESQDLHWQVYHTSSILSLQYQFISGADDNDQHHYKPQDTDKDDNRESGKWCLH